MKESQHPHLSLRSIFEFFGVILLLAVIYISRDILTALIFAVIIASAIEPGIEWLKDHKIPRILSVVFIYCAIAFILFCKGKQKSLEPVKRWVK